MKLLLAIIINLNFLIPPGQIKDLDTLNYYCGSCSVSGVEGISELILLPDGIFANIYIEKRAEGNKYWFSYGRYLKLGNMIYCRSHSVIGDKYHLNKIRTCWKDKYGADTGEYSKFFRELDNYTYEVETNLLLDKQLKIKLDLK